jgi:hypothetical protein
LNDFLLAYGNVDVSRGEFQLFMEVAAAEGKYDGYIKPFFDDVDFKNVSDEDKNVGQRIWENVVSGLSKLVKNKPRDQVATRIPFSGEFGDTDVGVLATIGNLLRHGFGRALAERFEGRVFTPSDDTVLKPADEKKSAEAPEEKTPEEKQADREEKAFDDASHRGKRP